MAGLFSSKAAPPSDDEDDYSDDAAPVDDDLEAEGDPAIGGPFESYCETVFSDTASYDEKCDALREAIMTLIDEMGMGGAGGPPPPPGVLGDL